MLRDDIAAKLRFAMKAGDSLRLSVYRMLMAAIQNREIEERARAGKAELSDEQILGAVRSELKKRRDATEGYRAGGRAEAAAREDAEAQILQEFLPAELSDEELERVASEALGALGSQNRDFGKAMGAVMARVNGRASGERVRALVQKIIG